MADYLLKKVDNKLWKEIKKLAIDKGVTVKRLILDLLKAELKANKNRT